MKIELKNLKHCEFMSDETNCFSATVYVDGIKTCTVENEGRGGCNMYPWIFDREMFDKVNEYCKALPKKNYQGYDLQPDLDILIDDEMQKMLHDKWMKRQCKKQTLFQLKGDESNAYRTVKAVYSIAVKQFLMKKYGDTLDKIYNEQYQN